MTEEKKITLSFTPRVMDYIAQTLAARPYGEVAGIISDIQQQIALQQMAPVETPPAPEVKPNGKDTHAAARANAGL